ncbi:MAG: hypothetical protein AAGA48_20630 [Myxococcota bacterium]
MLPFELLLLAKPDPVDSFIARHDQMLLVFDNAESDLDGVATVLNTLLPRCPNLCVLATSRMPVGLRLGQRLPPRGVEHAFADGEQPALPSEVATPIRTLRWLALPQEARKFLEH